MGLFGDVAIYVAPGSADHRAHPELFQDGLRGRRAARRLRDAPASCGATRSMTGPRCSAAHYRWWVQRLQRTLELFDLVRIDHFRGLVAYWAVPETDRDRGGRALAPRPRGGAVPGPGARARASAARRRGPRRHHAGGRAPARRSRPARDDRRSSSASIPTTATAPTGSPTTHENRIVYTGTHDNDTARGWYESLDASVRAAVDAALERGGGGRGPASRGGAWSATRSPPRRAWP